MKTELYSIEEFAGIKYFESYTDAIRLNKGEIQKIKANIWTPIIRIAYTMPLEFNKNSLRMALYTDEKDSGANDNPLKHSEILLQIKQNDETKDFYKFSYYCKFAKHLKLLGLNGEFCGTYMPLFEIPEFNNFTLQPDQDLIMSIKPPEDTQIDWATSTISFELRYTIKYRKE